MTNADRIRSMTDDELNDLLETVTDFCYDGQDCDNCQLVISSKIPRCNIWKWLKQEVNHNADMQKENHERTV